MTALVAAGGRRCGACAEPTASAAPTLTPETAPGWASTGRWMTLALAPTLALLTVHPVLAAFGASHLGLIDLFVAIAACPACLAAGYRVEHAHGPGERPSFFATAVGLFLIMLNGAVVIAGWSLAALLSM